MSSKLGAKALLATLGGAASKTKKAAGAAVKGLPGASTMGPGGLALGAVGAGYAGAQIGGAFREDFLNLPERRNLELFARQPDPITVQARNLAMQQSVRQMQARLQQENPHLYAEILAGRRLPRGAVVFGMTQPNTDLMAQTLVRMASSGQGI